MPGFDGTGPNGQGPMSPKGIGQCPRDNERQRCFGRGCLGRRCFNKKTSCDFWQSSEPLTIKDKIENLELYKKRLQEEIEILKKKDKVKNG